MPVSILIMLGLSLVSPWDLSEASCSCALLPGPEPHDTVIALHFVASQSLTDAMQPQCPGIAQDNVAGMAHSGCKLFHCEFKLREERITESAPELSRSGEFSLSHLQ